MLLVLVFMLHARRRRLRRASWLQRNGPLLMLCGAIPLILADPVRHVLQDVGAWPACVALPDGSCAWYSSAQYVRGQAESVQDENLANLSVIGALFLVLTYTGFALLAVATIWNAELPAKISAVRVRWAQLRAQAAGAAAPAADAYVAVEG